MRLRTGRTRPRTFARCCSVSVGLRGEPNCHNWRPLSGRLSAKPSRRAAQAPSRRTAKTLMTIRHGRWRHTESGVAGKAGQVRSRGLLHAAWKMQCTAARPDEILSISMVCCHRTFSEQSGALENIALRETKFVPHPISALRSFSQRRPQILGIFSPGISDREFRPRAKWRRKRCWQLTLSACR